MTRRAWARLDNASNIFLAARTDADPKVFRLSAEMDDDVDLELLQQALDATYDRYRLYHAVLRSGLFWYYLQDSDLRPLVIAEEQPTCAPIYQADRRRLLFRVMHHRRRIILEVFHALSDGKASLELFSQGGAFVNNLICGTVTLEPVVERPTPYHLPHSTQVAGYAAILGGHVRPATPFRRWTAIPNRPSRPAMSICRDAGSTALSGSGCCERCCTS